MRERVVANIAFAVSLVDVFHLLLNDLQEVTCALGTLIATRTLGAPFNIALDASVVFQEIAVDAFCTAIVSTGTLDAVGELLAALNLVVLVEEVAKSLLDTAGA